MKFILLSALLQFITITGFAQTNCAVPALKVFAKDKELLFKKGNKLPAEITLKLTPAASCELQGNYSIISGKVYLVSGSFPKKIKEFSGSTIVLKDWQKLYRSGERLVVEITAATHTDQTGKTETITESLSTSIPLK